MKKAIKIINNINYMTIFLWIITALFIMFKGVLFGETGQALETVVLGSVGMAFFSMLMWGAKYTIEEMRNCK